MSACNERGPVTPVTNVTRVQLSHIYKVLSLLLAFHLLPNYSDRHILINMGMSYRRYLSGERIYGCSTCKTHLATINSMMSRVRFLLIFSTILIISHLANDRLSMANMGERIFSKACKSFTLLMSDHLAYLS